jgi:hypothetical protein
VKSEIKEIELNHYLDHFAAIKYPLFLLECFLDCII